MVSSVRRRDPAGTDTGGSGWGHSVPPTGRHSEVFSQEIVLIHQGRSFSPFLHRVVRISSRVACNRKASTLWRGGALWGKLRTRCHQTRGLGPGRASSSSRTFCPSCWGRHAWEREGCRLLVHHVDPRPGSRCSSLDKPSRTRAGGRGEGRGSPALPRRERKNEILGESENPSSLNHRETKSLPK